MDSTEQDAYALPRDSSETNRLNTQHQLYRKNIDYLLHPRVATTLPHNAVVADVGCATGIWLRDVFAESPASWYFVGLDLSEDQFPKDVKHQERVTYAEFDILKDVPVDYVRKFDVVHLSLLIARLRHGDWTIAARNALRMLKPGGWIQWLETDSANTIAVHEVPGSSRRACEELLEQVMSCLKGQEKYLPNDVKQLKGCLEAVGLENCFQDVVASDRIVDTRMAMSGVQYQAVVTLSKRLAEQDSNFGLTSDEVEKLVQRCHEELEDGKVYSSWYIHTLIGRSSISLE